MLKRTNVGLIVGIIVVAAITLATLAQTKATAPKPQDRVALGEEQARQLLLLIDTDKKGKISKQEWMRFMEAEFDRLDKSGSGRLNLKELTESQVHVTPFSNVGK